jgi:hypothetical protein
MDIIKRHKALKFKGLWRFLLCVIANLRPLKTIIPATLYTKFTHVLHKEVRWQVIADPESGGV